MEERKTIRQFNPMDSITKNPEWSSVQEIIQEQINELTDVRDIDDSLPAEEFKIEIMARKLAQKKLQEFYEKYGLVTKEIEESNTAFK